MAASTTVLEDATRTHRAILSMIHWESVDTAINRRWVPISCLLHPTHPLVSEGWRCGWSMGLGSAESQVHWVLSEMVLWQFCDFEPFPDGFP